MAEKSVLSLLRKRLKMKKRKPAFNRQEGYRFDRLKDTWRKPRGRHSKLREHRKARGRLPDPGYGSPKAVRGLTKDGYRRVTVSNKADLQKLDKGKDAAVIASAVGSKKRMEIILEAEKTGVKVLNAYKLKLKG